MLTNEQIELFEIADKAEDKQGNLFSIYAVIAEENQVILIDADGNEFLESLEEAYYSYNLFVLNQITNRGCILKS